MSQIPHIVNGFLAFSWTWGGGRGAPLAANPWG